jgi:hypothetical protein
MGMTIRFVRHGEMPPRAWAGAASASFLLCTFLSSLAVASPTFPPAIQDHLELACEPDCTNCHTRPEGGLGTARQPFGLAMQQGGLSAGRPEKIPAALDHLDGIGSDVDSDGTPDIEELKNGTNPNAANEPLKCFEDASNSDDGGCRMATARTSRDPTTALLGLGAIGAAAVFFATRRRK